MPRYSISDRLPAGKLPAGDLARLLASLPATDPRVLLGPRPGEDAAVIEMGDRCLVAATDPVTFATDRIGWYAVHVNANDVGVMGAQPRWFLAVLLLPAASSTRAQARAIMDDIGATCDELGVTVCGGHTETTPGIERPIVVGQMLGEVAPQRLLRKSRLAVGDDVILTQGAAIEGTAILARELRPQLDGRVPDELLERAGRLLFDPGISVLPAVRVALDAGDVHAMHDPTEGGVTSALAELAATAGQGLEVFADRIAVIDETRIICECLDVDPLRLIASGALLVATPPSATRSVTAALTTAGIPADVVAVVRPKDDGLVIRDGQGSRPLVPGTRDELARVMEGAR